MWKQLLAAFKSGGLHQEAFDEALLMLDASHAMHRDAVAALHQKGILVADIYDRDRQINKYERSVRRKVLTHFTVSPKPDINMGLVLTSIVIDIERIGDYTKNIMELATSLPEPFDGGELHEEILGLEKVVNGMFQNLRPSLENADVELARTIYKDHKSLSGRVERGLQMLRSGQAHKGHSGKAVTTALYLRYLKRVSAHIKNVATSVLNPYHRIGYKEKKKKADNGTLITEPILDENGSSEADEDLEMLEDDETRA
ncbi:MAG: PhoU domain-containing protein [Gemmatimonadota bacterium]|jgi:phosphate uptake regulator